VANLATNLLGYYIIMIFGAIGIVVTTIYLIIIIVRYYLETKKSKAQG